MSITRFRTSATAVLVAVLTTGCGTFSFNRSNLEMSGARALVTDREGVGRTGDNPFERIDLALELAPRGREDVEPGSDSDPIEKTRERIRRATIKFYDDPADQEKRRNRLQERLLGASVQRCGEYRKFLKQLEGETNWLLGAITTAAAGAGAIVTGAGGARLLSGIAAIFSGVRAEFNESLFQRLTIQVITDGFEARRRELYEKMQARQKEAIGTYPAEAAVKDALEYHAACSLIAGLEHAALSIERAENPGLEAAERGLIRAKRLQAIADNRLDDPLLLVTGFPRPIGGGSGGASAFDGGSPRDAYASRYAAIGRTEEKLRARLTELAAAKDDQKNQPAGKLNGKTVDVLRLRELVARAGSFTRTELETHLRKRAMDHDNTLRGFETDLLLESDPVKKVAKREDYLRALEDGKKIVADIDAVYVTFQLRMGEARKAFDDPKLTADELIKAAGAHLVDYVKWVVTRRVERVTKLVETAGDDKLKAAGKVVGVTTDVKAATVNAEVAKRAKQWDNPQPSGTPPTFPGDTFYNKDLPALEEALK